MASEENDPLMEERAGVRNTTAQFLRSFSILSDDSDFDELDEPDTPGDELDGGPYTTDVRHTITSGISVECGKHPEHETKIIPFSNVHKQPKGFVHIRPDCWIKGQDIIAQITHVQREDHPHMTRKAFNPNLFVSRHVKQSVMKARRKLKGSTTVIREDLTRANAHLLHEVIQHEKVKNAWTDEGKVVALLHNGMKTRIKQLTDIDRLSRSR